LKKYFDPGARKTQHALQLLEKAQALSKGNAIPRLDATMAALARPPLESKTACVQHFGL
jgi:HrpA-like RNA helicase